MSVSAATRRAPGAAESLTAALVACARAIVETTAGLALDDDARACPGGAPIAVYIATTGDLDGMTCIVATELAREFARRVYGLSDLADDMILEAAIELANVIAGHAAGVLADHGVTAEILRPPERVEEAAPGEAVAIDAGGALRIVLHRCGGAA